jgi:hypothetical protein
MAHIRDNEALFQLNCVLRKIWFRRVVGTGAFLRQCKSIIATGASPPVRETPAVIALFKRKPSTTLLQAKLAEINAISASCFQTKK